MVNSCENNDKIVENVRLLNSNVIICYFLLTKKDVKHKI